MGTGLALTTLRRKWGIVALVVLMLTFRLRESFRGRKAPLPYHSDKPKDLFVTGVVFYGRHDRARSLNCYIKVGCLESQVSSQLNTRTQRNLAENGGWLDEVIWAVVTEDQNDVLYLDEILEQSRSYKKLHLSQGLGYGYRNIWNAMRGEQLYVKIDDDIVRQETLYQDSWPVHELTAAEVWIAEDTVPRLIESKLRHPETLIVSANVVNNPLQNFLHYHNGALHPYLPQHIDRPTNSSPEEVSWRASHYPYWEASEDRSAYPDENHAGRQQWRRVKNDNYLNLTPAAEIRYEAWGKSYLSWQIAAQVHYSFLENLEAARLDFYRFDHLWHLYGLRQRINLIAISGSDIDRMFDHWPPDVLDEDMLVKKLGPILGRSEYRCYRCC